MTEHQPISASDNEAIEEAQPISAPVVFELIRREGVEELQRPASALIMSALVAGLALGFSVLGKALLHAYLPDAPWRPLVENLGYSIGFLLVIMGQMQLFTENTITAVCPLLSDPSARVLNRLLRLWGLVLLFNLIGVSGFSVALLGFEHVQPEVFAAVLEISHHAVAAPAGQILLMGVGAGWLIAALVWIMPNAAGAKAFLIVLVTWLISLAGFSHVIAGTGEAALLALRGDIGLGQALFGFTIPALIGNILGGTVIFTLLIWAQIRTEHARPEPEFSYDHFWRRNRDAGKA
jgi:formate/nitrite transporter FocA (FNT family)